MRRKLDSPSTLLPDTLEQCITTLRDIEQDYIDTIKHLETENEILKDEHYKDEELKRLQEKINKLTEDMHRGFPITQEEQERIDAWKDDHIHKKHWKKQYLNTKRGPVDCSFSYQFYPTVLDTVQIVKCSCGAEFQF